MKRSVEGGITVIVIYGGERLFVARHLGFINGTRLLPLNNINSQFT
ncbi:MAG: hypothetical protein ACI9C4_002242 [Paraglaciecola sp.]|jgi:hypothetical protein